MHVESPPLFLLFGFVFLCGGVIAKFSGYMARASYLPPGSCLARFLNSKPCISFLNGQISGIVVIVLLKVSSTRNWCKGIWWVVDEGYWETFGVSNLADQPPRECLINRRKRWVEPSTKGDVRWWTTWYRRRAHYQLVQEGSSAENNQYLECGQCQSEKCLLLVLQHLDSIYW